MAKRRQQVLDALAAGRVAEPKRKWLLLTLTIRHSREMALAHTLGLRKAWRKTRQRGSVQRIWKKNVAASIRAIEVKDGEKNGWHPHIHMAILTTDWSDAEAILVRDAWKELVTRELGADCCPDDAHAMVLSREWKDTYLTKLGLETTGTAKGMGPWAHAQAAAESYATAQRLFSREERARVYEKGDRSRARFREYEAATKGCRAIELDDRAAALAQAGERERCDPDYTKQDELRAAPSYEVDMTRVVETTIGAMSMMRVLRVLERAGARSIFSEALDVAARAPPYGADAALRAWLDEQVAVRFTAWRATPATGHSSLTS
jgi:hypothetical protein